MTRAEFVLAIGRAAIFAAVVTVVGTYAWFASGRTWEFRRVAPDRTTVKPEGGDFASYYAPLAESFLSGRLDLPHPVDPRWQKVVNAYDFDARAAQGLEWEMWDASFHRGRFYVYFSPLPVVLFYIPFRWVTGGYPADALVALVAATWSFLAMVALAWRALGSRARRVPFPLWVLFIGAGNLLPYALTHVRAYEVAVVTGMAMTASWAYALFRWRETSSARYAALTGLWAALATLARPNLVMLVAVTGVVLVTRWSRRAGLAALLPLLLIGGASAAYNHARFGNVFELGMTYQISYAPMWRNAPCSLCDGPDLLRFVNNTMHYVFWAPSVESAFPHVSLRDNVMDPAVSFGGGPEPVGGIGALSPVVLAGTFFALLLGARRSIATPLLAAAWLILFTLATCRWVTARYALDFMMLMGGASVVLVEDGIAFLEDAGLRVRALRLAMVALALLSIVLCVLLGFRGAAQVP